MGMHGEVGRFDYGRHPRICLQRFIRILHRILIDLLRTFFLGFRVLNGLLRGFVCFILLLSLGNVAYFNKISSNLAKAAR